MKILKIKCISTISSRSNESSNYSNSSSKPIFVSINSTKLEGSLHPFLRSFGQFLFTKIKFSKFSYCKRHLFKFVSMLIKEKKIVSICYPIMPKI